MTWLDHFRRDGYAVLRAVLDADEVRALVAECERVGALPGVLDPDNVRTHVAASGPRVPDRIDPISDLSPSIAALAADPRLVEPVAAAIGRPLTLMKDKAILKPPGAPGYELHQDAAYFPTDPPAVGAVIAVVALDASSPGNGCMEIVPGQFDLLSPPGEAADVDAAAVPPAVAVPLAPGDVLLFSALAPHRSDPNRSDGWRRHLYLTYVPDDGTDQRAAYYEAQHRRLREQLPPEKRARAVFR